MGDIAVANYLLAAKPFEPHKAYIGQLRAKADTDSFERMLVLQHDNRPLNDSSLRVVPFPLPTKVAKRKRMLFVGDSFTFGFSALPFTAYFVDYLNQTGMYEPSTWAYPGQTPLSIWQYDASISPYWCLIKW